MIRAFLAVELPESLRQEVAAFQSQLKTARGDVKWVELDNLHLTLKFLGNIEESQLPSLKETLAAGVREIPPFAVHLEGIGAFPGTMNPRVIWVGASEGKESLIELAQAAERTCSDLGFTPEDRPFSAHLTIGRVRSRERLAPLIKKLQAAEFRGSVPAPVEKIVLFQSTLSPRGPTYTPLGEIPLTPG